MNPKLRYPERLLQPFKNLRQFTQEFYAMLKNAEADDVSGGLADEPPRARPGVPPGGAKRSPSGDFDLPEPRDLRRGESAPAAGPGKFATVARRASPPERRRQAESVLAEERRRQAAAAPRLPEPARRRRVEPGPEPAEEGRRREAPAVESPERRSRPEPARDEPRKPAAFPPPPGVEEPKHPAVPFVDVGADLRGADFNLTGGGGGTTVFIGKVGIGTGARYQVTLYPDGPDGDPDPDPVEVKILTLSEGEVIPPDTWIAGVFQFDDTYYAQVPVWME